MYGNVLYNNNDDDNYSSRYYPHYLFQFLRTFFNSVFSVDEYFDKVISSVCFKLIKWASLSIWWWIESFFNVTLSSGVVKDSP